MGMSFGSSKGRTPAETIEKATGYLSDKEMPRATVMAPGRRYTARPPAKPQADRPSSNDNAKE